MGGSHSRTGHVLCLDGGGIRGMVSAKILEYIEEQTNRKTVDSFEWIVGTSTGGILALYLALGHTATECLELYKTLKDDVFGSKAYKELVSCFKDNKRESVTAAVIHNTSNYENILKRYFGETTEMADIKDVKIIITVTNGEHDPLKLVHYTNYDPDTRNELIWQVARATSAAPGYFERFEISGFGPLFDGGLTANNPTLTALGGIIHYYQEKSEKINLKTTLSIGTGERPVKDTSLPDIPLGLWDIFWSWAKGDLDILISMLTNELTRTDGYVVDQARSMCSILKCDYYRSSPKLSEDISLDETDDKKLNQMIDDTENFIKEYEYEFQKLIHSLNK